MASVNIPLSEFSELCRLCGSKTSVLMGLHIFEREGNLRQIYKKINACLPIQVHNTDKLPKMVCEECVYNLDALFEFRERSMKTEYELNSMLKELYTPVCNDSLPIEMDPLICETTSSDSLQVQSSVEVTVPLESSSQQLEDIVITTIKDSSNSIVKCEPELIMEVESQTQQHNKNQGAHFTEEPLPDSEIDSENDSLGAGIEPSVACSLRETLDANLQEQHIRTLQSIDESMKETEDVSTNGSFLVHTQADQPWFFCDICGKPFDNSDEFQAHCEIHWKKCTICGISCTNDEALMEHVREVHTPPIEMIPQVPPPPPQVLVTASPPSASPNLIRPEGETEEKKPKLDMKRETSKPGEMKACTECGKEYRTNYKLAEHMRKHTGEKPFKCSMCEKAFRSKIGLAQHEAKHTGQFDYTCSTCGKGFQCKSYLIVHQRVHSDLKPYPCDTCGRNFKSKQSLLDHQNRHLGVKPYLCETCGRGFITKGLCKSHQKVHSGTDNRQYPCSVCNKLFVSKSYLATHRRIHTGEKPFMCEVCGKGFLTRVDLRIHSTMHTGEKSFVCEVCGKAFARRDALRCHKRSHTGERPYRCDICGQGFTQFSPMAIHKRLHTGERPYSCDICAKTFVSRSTMMSHRKKHVS